MTELNFVLLYVENPARSAAFYGELLGRKLPAEQSETFILLPAANGGATLGLWARPGVEPPAGPVGGGEFAFVVESAAAVDARYEEWSRRGLTIAQKPTTMDFGRTFVALDPDGHRLRVCAPDQP